MGIHLNWQSRTIILVTSILLSVGLLLLHQAAARPQPMLCTGVNIGGQEDCWWNDIVIVGIHPFNWMGRHKELWKEIFQKYPIQLLDRSTGLNDITLPTYDRVDQTAIKLCHDLGIKVATYLILTPYERCDLFVDPTGERWAFSDLYYSKLPDDQKWRDLNGNIITDPYEGGAGKSLYGYVLTLGPRKNGMINSHVYMSLSNPYWLEYQIESAKLTIDANMDAIDVDNVIRSPFYGTGDYSDWSKHAFRDYLGSRYDSEELRRMGIRDISEFDIALYIDRNYARSAERVITERDTGKVFILLSPEDQDRLLSDPIIKDWVKFNHHSHLTFFKQFATEVRRYAKSHDKIIPVFGNQHMGFQPGSIILSPYFDLIQIEADPPIPPRFRSTVLYRIGIAMGEYAKPVWVHGAFYDEPPNTSLINLLKISLAEAYGNGGIREIDFCGFPGVQDVFGTFIIDGEIPEELAQYVGFLRENRDLFRGAQPLSKVAIVYSIPSFLWHTFPGLGIWNDDQWHAFVGYARALEEAHIPYDVIILGHPDLYDDALMLQRFSYYDVIILPNIDAISDQQVDLIKKFVEEGGGLVATGEVATYDEDYNERPVPGLVDLLRHEFNFYGQGRARYITGEPDIEYYINVIEKGQKDPKNFKRLIDAVSWASLEDLQIETDAPNTTMVSVITQPSRFDRILIHMVNYDYNTRTDDIKPVRDIRLRMELPSDFKVGGVLLLSPDFNSTNALNYTISNDYIEFIVPELRIWDLIVIKSKAEINVREIYLPFIMKNSQVETYP